MLLASLFPCKQKPDPIQAPRQNRKSQRKEAQFRPQKKSAARHQLNIPSAKSSRHGECKQQKRYAYRKIPMILERIPVPGMVKTDRSPDAKAAATKESGISMVSQSTNPTTKRSPRKRITVTDAAGLSKYIWDATAAAPPKTMLIRYLGRNPPLRNAR